MKTIVLTHVSPDLDAFGSLIGLMFILRDNGQPDVRAFADISNVPSSIESLVKDNIEDCSALSYEDGDALYVVDCGDASRVCCPESVRPFLSRAISLDHHCNDLFGAENYGATIDAAAGMTVYKWAMQKGYEVSPVAASFLLLAVLGDTGRLILPNTTAECLRVVSELVTICGQEKFTALNRMLDTVTDAKTRLWCAALNTHQVRAAGRLRWAVLTREEFFTFSAKASDTQGLANRMLCIDDTQVAVLVYRADAGDWHINIRSTPDSLVTAKELAQRFDGGGHVCAAGCRTATFTDARYILDEIEKTINNTEVICLN